MTERAYDGSSALQMPLPEPEVQTDRVRRWKPQPEPVPKSVPEEAPRQNWTAAPAVMGAIFCVAAVVVLILISYAQLVIVNDELVGLRSELSELESEKTKLMSQYELAYDLQEIEKQMIASGQMNKIQNWQTYTLELSEPDSVEYYHGSDMREQLMSFARNLVTGIQEYFGFGTT